MTGKKLKNIIRQKREGSKRNLCPWGANIGLGVGALAGFAFAQKPGTKMREN